MIRSLAVFMLLCSYASAQQDAAPVEEEEEVEYLEEKWRPDFNWNTRPEFYAKQLALQFNMPSGFCTGEENSEMHRVLIDEVPRIYNVRCPAEVEHHFADAVKWINEEAPSFKSQMSIVTGRMNVEPYMIKHPRKTWACMPKGEGKE